MKKLLLVAVAMLGAVAASNAGVRVHFGVGIPFPLPGAVVIGRPAPVVVASPAYPAPVIVAPPVCAPPVLVAPPVVACPPAAVVIAPPRHVVYYHGRPYYGHEWEHIHHHR